jgi:ATP-dependent Lon protease
MVYYDEIESTAQVPVPSNPLDRVIGQEHAVQIAKIAAKQRRHLLLVGVPGVGKSMIAQGIAHLLPKPQQEISVLHNPKQPERPLLEIRTREQVMNEKEEENKEMLGQIIEPHQAPVFVAEKLGFRCKRCGFISSPSLTFCPNCGADKHMAQGNVTPFGDIVMGMQQQENLQTKVFATRRKPDGTEESLVYERTPDDKIRVMRLEDLKKEKEAHKKKRNVIVPLNRKTFVRTSGASETEFLGDVKHDPYGGHPEIGVPTYMRVVAGAIHEAHEGVLYVDEMSTLGELQRYLLTAMQDKVFPIVGRNPTSTGAVVKVENVPCNFIFIGAVNIVDLHTIIPALRSRIRGEGYEVLLKTWMPDTEDNRNKIVQFIAQEIVQDGKIPHMTREGVKEVIELSKRWAKIYDNALGLTLRLRNLAGIIRLAGDLAKVEGEEYITAKHVRRAVTHGRAVEEQIAEVYGNWWKASQADSYVRVKSESSGVI